MHFRENHEYRELDPKEGRHKWRFVTSKPTTLALSRKNYNATQQAEFFDANDHLWMTIELGVNIILITIEKGYAWNGATPKRWIWPFGWMGVPDFEATRKATLFHDVLCQFQLCEHMPFTRLEIDGIFRDMIGNSFLAKTYFAGVRLGGRFVGRTTHGEYSKTI